MKVQNPAPGSDRWVPSEWFLAQSTHVGWAIAFYLPTAAILGWNPLWVLIGVAVVTGIKEFVLDIFVLEGDTRWGSLQDWGFWQAGNLGGFLLCVAFWFGLGLPAFVMAMAFLLDYIEQLD